MADSVQVVINNARRALLKKTRRAVQDATKDVFKNVQRMLKGGALGGGLNQRTGALVRSLTISPVDYAYGNITSGLLFVPIRNVRGDVTTKYGPVHFGNRGQYKTIRARGKLMPVPLNAAYKPGSLIAFKPNQKRGIRITIGNILYFQRNRELVPGWVLKQSVKIPVRMDNQMIRNMAKDTLLVNLMRRLGYGGLE